MGVGDRKRKGEKGRESKELRKGCDDTKKERKKKGTERE